MACCRIDLRHDQSSSLIEQTTNNGKLVRIYAPSWVEEALRLLTIKLNGVKFEVHDNTTKHSIIQEFTITEDNPLDLIKLQLIARCEPRNVTGVINRLHYSPAGLSEEVIFSIRDLVRQCIIVGKDETTHYGGYPSGQRIPQKEKVYIVDLSGLQFQQAYNTGRLVLVKDKIPIGFLDDLIFENVVGEKKKTFKEIDGEKHQHGGFARYTRYLCTRSGVPVDAYFDTKAYRKFISKDVQLTGKALIEMVGDSGDSINFKFLKYGTGFFAGNLKEYLEHHLLPGVLDGLEKLFTDDAHKIIKSIEFPFYREDTKSHSRLEHLKSKYGITYKFSHDDALKNTTKSEGLITATTNCADPHAPTGNEMGFGSVDGAIAENLKSKGNIFCPALNKAIQTKYLNINND